MQPYRRHPCWPEKRRCNCVRLVLAVLFVSGLWDSADVYASTSPDGSDVPLLLFSGFGTLGAVHSNNDRADFTGGFFQPNGAGYTHSWSTDVDSLIAGQVAATFTPELSAVVQAISRQGYNNTYAPQVEWANIKYKITPDLSIRAGRTLLPTFFLSDTQNIGYTYAWVRPPVEVYRLLPVDTNDGLDVSYRLNVADLANTIQANYGYKSTNLTNNGGTAKARGSWGVFLLQRLSAIWSARRCNRQPLQFRP